MRQHGLDSKSQIEVILENVYKLERMGAIFFGKKKGHQLKFKKTKQRYT